MKSTLISYKTINDDIGKTVETILKHKLLMSSALICKLKHEGKIFINSTPCRSIDTIKEECIVSADIYENDTSSNIIPKEMALEVVYDDDLFTIVNKPRKMCVHPCPESYENTLANGIINLWNSKGEYHKFHAVTRIDKDTSGICIIAKNSYGHNALTKDNKSLEKKYLAIIDGVPSKKQGRISEPIDRSPDSIIKRCVSKTGKPSVTDYSVIKTENNLSLTEIKTKTGRTHQIRVHMAHLGTPLLRDWLYGKDSESQSGHLLHVSEVTFVHPLTKERINIHAPMPKDMTDIFPSV